MSMRGYFPAAVLALTGACHFGDDLKVVSASPEGELGHLPQRVEILFDKPLVDPDQAAAMPKGLQVEVDPPLGGQVSLPTPTSVTYAFASAPLPAQEYEVSLSSGLRSADGKAVLKSSYDFAFTTPLNAGVTLHRLPAATDPGQAFPREGDSTVTSLALDERLLLTLRFPETVARLKALVQVVGEPMAGGEARPLPVKLAFPDPDTADQVLIAPDGNWPKHTYLRVTIRKGLRVARIPAGSLASREDQVLSAATYGPIAIQSGPDCQMCRPPATLVFTFSTPVECADVLPRVTLKPKPDALHCAGQSSPTSVRIEPEPALKAYTQYKVTVRPGVTDKFGQELNTEASFVLKTGDPNPRFAHQLMFNVLERRQGGAHEEKVHRTHELKVEGAKLPFAEAWRIIAAQGLADQVAWSQLPWWLADDYGYDDCTWDDEAGEEVCDSNSARRFPGYIDADDVNVPGGIAQKLKVDDPKGWSVVEVPLDPYLKGQGGLVVLKATPYDGKGGRLSNPVLRLINVTDIGLSARYSPTQLVVLAARLSDGKPVTGAKIDVYAVLTAKDSELGEAIATGTTDAQGLATFTGSQLARPGDDPSLHARGLFVTASSEDDQAFIWSSFQSGGRRATAGTELLGSVYTERGVYRPGETVFYRAVVRKPVAGGFATPQGKIKLTARRAGYYNDEDGDEGGDDSIFTTTAKLSAFGTLHGKFQVPAEARVGDYQLVAELDGGRTTGSFKVAEFRRAEMKVTVNTDKSEYVRGQTMSVRINADYLFGAPAAGQPLRWSLRRSYGYFESKRFPAARFSDYGYMSWYDQREAYSDFLDEGEARLDDKGSFAFERSLEESASGGKIEDLVVSATVEDASGQAVSHRRVVNVHPSGVHVGIVPHGYLKEVDKLFTFEVVAVSILDEPAAKVPVQISSHQEYWTSVKRKGPGGRMYWDYQRQLIDDAGVCKGKTDERGVLTCQLTPRKGGSIRLRAEAKDAKGRVTRASSWFWVTGDPNYYGGRSESSQVGVMSEAPEVEPGHSARIAITSPFRDALALVTVEREEILWRKVMPIGASGTVDIPVAASWVPNVYVSATVVRGRVTPEGDMRADPERDKPAYAMGHVSLKVKPTQNLLKVALATNKPDYEPGQSVLATLALTDHTGAPAAAEVNLFAVDEGVLILTGYRTPDLVPDMFAERPYAVLALDTRKHVLGKRHFITPVIKGEEDGGGGGAESNGDGEGLRQDFNPVATWLGSLVVGANGKASHSFKVPDTLTTYRLMAVAVNETDRFGSGEASFTVKKTLMMRQAMPRFARPGDTLQAGVVVNQLSGKDDEVTVEIEKIDDTLFKVGERKLVRKVGAKETAAFRFDLSAADADGASEIIFAARMGAHRDRVQLVLPVKRLQPRESRAVSGVLESGSVTHTLALPAEARPVALEVHVSGLPVASLEEKMRQLVGYPYGCLEQRTSKVMPLIAVRELADKLGFASIPKDKIKGWVDEWVALVPKYRCGDDGFDYYPGCSSGSDPYLTAFALDGLVTARRFGYQVPDTVIDPAARFLEARLAGMEGGASWDHNTTGMAGALRVLAELKRSKPAFENALYEGRAKLPLFARTELTRAIFSRTGKRDDKVDTLVKEILAGGVQKDGRLVFKADDPNRYWWAWDSDLRSTAMVLQTLLEVVPTDSRVPLMIRGLVDLDGAESYYTTQGTTQTLLALARAADVLAAVDKQPVAGVKLNDRALLADRKIGGKVESAKLAATELAGAPYKLALTNSGAGPLFFGAFLRYAYPATARLPAESHGFRIERRYLRRDGKSLGDAATVGDFVQVEISVWPEEEGRMVVIDDPLPAGLEPVDTSLATSDTEMAQVAGERDRDWSWWRSRYAEIRDDRVEWHFRQLYRWSNDPIQLRYLTRATTPGVFYAPGTMVERMYQPHVRGRAAGRMLTVKPKS